MIFRFNIEDKKTYQMLEALEHPLGSPGIFQAKENGECFAPLATSSTEVSYYSKSLQNVLHESLLFELTHSGLSALRAITLISYLILQNVEPAVNRQPGFRRVGS